MKNVACGTRHALFSLQNGSVLGCGANSRHQLGTMDAKETNTPRQITSLPDNTTQVACGSFHSLCLTREKITFVIPGYLLIYFYFLSVLNVSGLFLNAILVLRLLLAFSKLLLYLGGGTLKNELEGLPSIKNSKMKVK